METPDLIGLAAARLEPHTNIAMAALAVGRWPERQTRLSIRKLVQTLRQTEASPSRPAATSCTDTPLNDGARDIITRRDNAAMGH